jgi:hypothetical protein
MSFMIVIGSVATTPPVYAMPSSTGSPVIEYAPVVRRHEPTARNAQGYPVGVSSELFTTIGRTVIGVNGLQWWYDTAGLSTNVSTEVIVRLFDPVSAVWSWYRGLAWRPTYKAGQAGNKVRDFAIHISNLSPLTWIE